MSVLNTLAARLAPQTVVTTCRYFSSRWSSIHRYSNRCSSSSLVVANRYFSNSQRFRTDFRDPENRDPVFCDPSSIQSELRAPRDDEIVQLAKYEYELLKNESPGSVPDEVTDEQWEELGQLSNEEKRFKYFHFLQVRESWKKKRQETKMAKREHSNAHHEEIVKKIMTNPHISYGLWRNAIFVKRANTHMDRMSHLKMVRSKLLGQSIILDFDYEQFMNRNDISDVCRQIVMAYALNKYYDDPFYLQLFNYDRGGKVADKMRKMLPTIESDGMLMDLHSGDMVPSYRPEDLVIITSHSRTDMVEVDSDLTYVIPAYVGRGGNKPYAIAKAKKEGIRHVRIPYDRYLHIGRSCRKDLPLNIVMCILNEVKQNGCWESAFRKHFPKRMLDTSINDGFKATPSYGKLERWNVLRDRFSDADSYQEKPYRKQQSGRSYDQHYDYSQPESSYNLNYDSNQRGGSRNHNYDSIQPERSYNQNYDSNQRGGSRNQNYDSSQPERSYNQDYDFNQRGGSRNQNYDSSQPERSYTQNRDSNQRGGSWNQNYDSSQPERSYTQNRDSNQRSGSRNQNYDSKQRGGSGDQMHESSSRNMEDGKPRKNPESTELQKLIKFLK